MSRNEVLSGNLGFLSLAELLQLLGTNGSTGVLRLSSSFASAPGVIHLVNGNPVNASNASLVGLEALYALFGWSEAAFVFSLEKVEVPRLINRNPMEIILDGLRMLDDGEIAKLGPVSYRRTRSGGLRGDAGEIALIKRPLIHYVNLADEEAFSRGARIVEEGKFGSWLWVMLGGVAEVVKETPRGPIPLFRIGEGACIGNFSSVVKMGFRRLATVVAASERVQLGVLDPRPFHAEFANLSRESRALLISLDNRMRGLLENIAAIHAGSPQRPPKERRAALEQGSGDARVFQIHRGQALVFRRTAEGEVPLASLSEEDLFGQLPFLTLGHEPQSAVVYAPADLKVRPLNPDSMQQEYDQLSPALRNVLDFSASCLSVSTAVACAAFRKTHPAGLEPRSKEKGGDPQCSAT